MKLNEIIDCFYRSDEGGRVFVYRQTGERFNRRFIQTVARSGRKSVSVWAWYSQEGAGSLHRIEGTLKKEQYVRILETVLLPYATARFPNGFVFVQDRSPVHTSNILREWFNNHPQITLMDWPPKGADLNPIENVWGLMVREMDRTLVNQETLWLKVVEIWNRFTERNRLWYNLSNSMPNRIADVVECNGGWSKY